MTGFSLLSNGYCDPICAIPYCTQCSTSTVCVSCQNILNGSKLTLYNGVCNLCPDSSCISCISNYDNMTSICLSCNGNLSPSLNGMQCLNCKVSNCLACSGNNLCAACEDSYSLMSNTCIKCIYPCSSCLSNGTCMTCALPFSTIPSAIGKCYLCNNLNCLTCS
jgi:hypothetical protein